MPEPPKAAEDSDFYFVEINEPEEGVPTIIQMIKERMPRRFGLDPMKDIQVLCPMNRGVLGARNLNIQLQEVLNPNPPRWRGLAGASRREIGSWKPRTTMIGRCSTAILAR